MENGLRANVAKFQLEILEAELDDLQCGVEDLFEDAAEDYYSTNVGEAIRLARDILREARELEALLKNP